MNLVLVGLGYWGPNLLRTFNSLGVLKAAFDISSNKLEKFKRDSTYSNIIFGTDWSVGLTSTIDGVIIATPPNTHYEIAIKAIKSGKHVFIEKPLTLNIDEANSIVYEANKRNLIVFVGHIFLYSPEIIKLKEIINRDEFGDVRYVYTQRLNLGQIQSPANVVEDLAPHDISILNYLLDDECNEVLTVAKNHVANTEDVAFISMKFKTGILAHLHLSWLDPLKVRNTVVVGLKQMVVCDSMSKKIEIYNKSVDLGELHNDGNISFARHLMTYRYGDVILPYIDNHEPLLTEAKEFLRCIETKEKPLACGELGVNVVKVLMAMQKSLKEGQIWQKI